MRHWLMKSEPDAFSIDELKRKGTSPWDGVRNYQARNFMREMQLGDRVLFYHSNAKPSGVAGLAEVSRLAYPDHTQFDQRSDYYDPASTTAAPRWWMVELRFVQKFPATLALDELKRMPELSDMLLFSRSRLSVQPVSPEHYAIIVRRADRR